MKGMLPLIPLQRLWKTRDELLGKYPSLLPLAWKPGGSGQLPWVKVIGPTVCFYAYHSGVHCFTQGSCRSLLQSLPVQVTARCFVLCTCPPSCPETQFSPGHFLCFKWFTVSAEKAQAPYPTIQSLSPRSCPPSSPLPQSLSFSFLQEFLTPVRLLDSGSPCMGPPSFFTLPWFPSLMEPSPATPVWGNPHFQHVPRHFS